MAEETRQEDAKALMQTGNVFWLRVGSLTHGKSLTRHCARIKGSPDPYSLGDSQPLPGVPG